MGSMDSMDNSRQLQRFARSRTPIRVRECWGRGYHVVRVGRHGLHLPEKLERSRPLGLGRPHEAVGGGHVIGGFLAGERLALFGQQSAKLVAP